jgi:hypothetical protein
VVAVQMGIGKPTQLSVKCREECVACPLLAAPGVVE